MGSSQQDQVTKAALETTRTALDDDRLSDAAKLLYLDVVARYAGSYGWMVGSRSWDQDHLDQLALLGYVTFSPHNHDTVYIDAIDDALRSSDDD